MFRLDNLQPSGKKKKRIGRGGQRGGTSGRGHKGQKSRSGGTVSRGFEGGQTPLNRRLPKRGFTNARFSKELSVVTIDLINRSFNEGEEVSPQELLNKNLIKPKKSERQKVKQKIYIKVLGNGKIDKKLTVSAHAFSNSAKQAIEKAGGQVKIIKEL